MAEGISTLEQALRKKQLQLPLILQDLSCIQFLKSEIKTSVDEELHSLFPSFTKLEALEARATGKRQFSKKRVGVVLSGGQASGGHNVIAGLFDALKTMNSESSLIGFLGGPSGIINGKTKEITLEVLSSYRNQGGFDLLGSGRTKIETSDQLKQSLQNIKDLNLDGLVVIGGDDSNTNACVLAQYLQDHDCKTTVVGVPKTIDGDLQNDFVGISFGFDSACRVYSEVIGNIARDAISAKKYYHFIRLMGRSASHVTLECALSTQVNYAIILEEVAANRWTLSQIIHDICDMISQRSEMGKNYGVILIPEGLLEFIPEVGVLIKELNQILLQDPSSDVKGVLHKLSNPSKECMSSLPESIQKQLLMARDPHGNVQVSLIETERLISEAVQKELHIREQNQKYKGSFSPINHFLGYEGRAGMPSNFDAHYCYSLGVTSALLIDEKASGYMAYVSKLISSLDKWSVGGVPLVSLMNLELRHGKQKPVIKKVLVDLSSRAFKTFSSKREDFKTSDSYLYPGPIQYFGPDEVSFCPPMTLILK